ncbi:MAG: hypothetical protein ACXVGQ_00215 [Mycobacteriaceae bacterium]
MTAPVAVLVARLEHELETLRLHVMSGAHLAATDSVESAQGLVAQIRAAL